MRIMEQEDLSMWRSIASNNGTLANWDVERMDCENATSFFNTHTHRHKTLTWKHWAEAEIQTSTVLHVQKLQKELAQINNCNHFLLKIRGLLNYTRLTLYYSYLPHRREEMSYFLF